MNTPKVVQNCCQPGVMTKNKQHSSAELNLNAKNNNSGPDISDAHFIALQGGWFRMGTEHSPHPEDGESPERDVFVDSFALASTAVTIKDYAAFVAATGYQTLAELTGSSFVFFKNCDNTKDYSAPVQAPWWREVPGACWRSPSGIDHEGNVSGNHPVTHIARNDALAYCHWSGTRLPSEAEWEFASRGPRTGQPYPWGNKLEQDGIHHANVWQGDFPANNTQQDGYAGVAPVDAYEPHGFGHYNMIGNVWEWVADRFTNQHSPRATRNPNGPLNGSQFVAKGGSYLCHASYCARYRTSSRQALAPDTTTDNLGFRIANTNQ